jgi:Leucine-rich repeat (LRR) protein
MGCCVVSGEENRKKLVDKINRGRLIKSFNFDKMNLHSLKFTDSLSDVNDIKIFSAQNNKLYLIPKKFFSNLNNIKNLDFSFNYFELIDEIIFTKISLVTLNFSNNNISELSENIKNLKNLKELILSHNQLIKIPNGVSYLQNLELLELSHNKIQNFPNFILDFEKLETVNISNNNISELPEDKWSNSKIKNFDISFNKLSAVPSDLLKNSMISNMNLKSNMITKRDFVKTIGYSEFEKRRKERKDQAYYKNLDVEFNLCGLD